MFQDPLSILLVDDEKSFVQILALRLGEEYGIQTTLAYSGGEAIEIIRSTNRGFDVILLDYRMPDVSGLNVLQWMHEQKNRTPVVMLTAAGSETIAVEAMKFGAADYLRKEQIDIPHLVNVLRSVHQSRLFEIEKEAEEEQAKAILLNDAATEKVRNVVNAITPMLNDSFAQIASELETISEKIQSDLPEVRQQALAGSLTEIQRNVSRLEAGIRGLLGLYYIVYAHHSEMPAIEHLLKEVEEAALRSKQRAVTPQKAIVEKESK